MASSTKQVMTALYRLRRKRQEQSARDALAGRFQAEFYARGWPATSPEQYKQDGGWITIGGGPATRGGRSVQHAGGTPVQVDGRGNIVKGPPDLKGTPVDNPGRDKGTGEPQDETPEERAAREQRQAARRAGMASGNPKPEAKAGDVKPAHPKSPPEIPPAGTPKAPPKETRTEAQARLTRSLSRKDEAQVGETQISLQKQQDGQYTAQLRHGDGRTEQAAAAGTREQAASAAVAAAIRAEFPEGPGTSTKKVAPPADAKDADAGGADASKANQQQTLFPGVAPQPAKKPRVTPDNAEQGRLIPKEPPEEPVVAAQPYPTDKQGRIVPWGERLRETPPPGVKEMPSGRWVGHATLHVDDVEMDPERFQYKMEVGEEGVSETLKEVKQFDPLYGGMVQVWRDPADRKTYVINGHHRIELAKRSLHKDANPNDPDDWEWHGEIPVRYINAGTERQARAIGALVNIAEGHGTALDAASYMKESGIKAGDLRKHNISLKGKVAEVAASLSELSPKLFSMVHSKVWSEKRGVLFGKHLPGNDRKQDELAQYIRDKEEDRKRPFTDEEVEEMAFAKSWASETSEQQETLSGTEEKKEDTFAEEAEIANQAKKSFAGVLRRLSGVSSEAAKAIIEGTGVGKIETGKAKEETTKARDLFDAFQRERQYKGPLREALAQAALGYKNDPKSRDKFVGQFLERAQGILEAIQRGGKGGDSGGSGVGPGGESGSEPDTRAEWERDRTPDPSVKMMFRREWNIRRVCERYAKVAGAGAGAGAGADSFELVRDSNYEKRTPIAANYRPAFSSARCAACRSKQGAGCQLVKGDVRPDDVCDLFAWGTGGQPEHYAKPKQAPNDPEFEKLHPRGEGGEFGTKTGGSTQGEGAESEAPDKAPAAPQQQPATDAATGPDSALTQRIERARAEIRSFTSRYQQRVGDQTAVHTEPKSIDNSADTAEELFADSQAAAPGFIDMITNAAQAASGQADFGPDNKYVIKPWDSLQDKVVNRGKPVKKIGDAVRGTIVAPTVEAVGQAVQNAARQIEAQGGRVLAIDDKFANPMMDTGYIGVHIDAELTLPNGRRIRVELQVHNHNLPIKHKSHEIYSRYRSRPDGIPDPELARSLELYTEWMRDKLNE